MKIDNIKNFHNGWFVGHFVPSVYDTEAFEIAYKRHKSNEIYERHFHKESIEINLLVSGTMTMQDKTLNSGDIFIVYPYEISDPKFITDCEVVVIRHPSKPKDKYII
jgi:mannose-6-phosphate isomerase-like protein (cupin superfamily)